MPLPDYLAGIQEQLANGTIPDDFMTRIQSEYDHDIGTRDATIADTRAQLATKDEDINSLKVKNYDLTMQVPGAPVVKPDEEVRKPITIDDLFGE